MPVVPVIRQPVGGHTQPQQIMCVDMASLVVDQSTSSEKLLSGSKWMRWKQQGQEDLTGRLCIRVISEPEPLHGEESDHLELSPQNEESNEQVDTDRMCGTATDLTLGTGAHNDVKVIYALLLGINMAQPSNLPYVVAGDTR